MPKTLRLIKDYFSHLPKVAVAIVSLLLLLNYLGILEDCFGFLRVSVDQYNSSYISAAEQHSLRNFFEISGLLAILAVLKTSSAGFSLFVDMQIQYGNILYPLFSLVEKGWYISLASLAVIEFIKLALEYSYALFAIFAYFLLSSYLVSLFFKGSKYQDFTKRLRNFSAYLFVIIHLAVPLYVAAMGAVSQKINAPLKQKVDVQLAALKGQLPQINNKSIGQYSKKYLSESEDNSSDIKSKLDGFSTVISRYILIELISIVLIPLSFVFLVYYSLKWFKRQSV